MYVLLGFGEGLQWTGTLDPHTVAPLFSGHLYLSLKGEEADSAYSTLQCVKPLVLRWCYQLRRHSSLHLQMRPVRLRQEQCPA